MAYLGEETGFVLANDSESELALNWKILVITSRMAADGGAWAPIAEAVTDLATLPAHVRLDVSREQFPETGLFRIDISFSDNEKVLGSYHEYVRVVPSVAKARLGISNRTVSPGDTFRIRLENLGTRNIKVRGPYLLQRFHSGNWQAVPQREEFPAPGDRVPAGYAGKCQSVHISKHAEPGLYRVSKRVVSLGQIQGKVRPLGWEVARTFRVKSAT